MILEAITQGRNCKTPARHQIGWKAVSGRGTNSQTLGDEGEIAAAQEGRRGQDQGSKEKIKEAEKYLRIKELRLHGWAGKKID